MRRALSGLLLFSMIGAALGSGTTASASGRPERSEQLRNGAGAKSTDFVPGEVIVRFKSSVPASERASLRAASGFKVADRIPGTSTEVLSLPRQASVVAAAARLAKDPRVASAEPNYILRMATPPNDTEWGNLWGFSNNATPHSVSADFSGVTSATGTADADGDVLEAWNTTQGTNETVVGVIDSGVDVNHPDLAANIWTNPGESGGGKENDGIDNDNNGYVDDVHGWDFARNTDQLVESFTESQVVGVAHGTHVAGTIAAVGNNSTGVVGVCPQCRIMVLKFMKPFDTDGTGGPDTMLGTTAAELKAIAYAKKKGADIVNGSYGSTGYSTQQRKALGSLKKAGVLGVFAAGNSAVDNDLSLVDGSGSVISPSYPATYDLPGIISVGASNHHDEYGYFTGCATFATRNACSMTNFGFESVDLMAPGIDIISTIPLAEPTDYETYNGTSMASPFTAGAAGLLASQFPTLTPVQLKNKLMKSVDKPANLGQVFSALLNSSSNAGWPGKWNRSNGRINVAAAFGAPTTSLPKTDGNISGALSLKASQKGSLVWGHDNNDVYKKKLEKGVKYRVKLDGPPVPAGEDGFTLDLIVWRPGTKDIWQPGKFMTGSFNGLSNDEVVTFKAPKSGKYYIHPHSFLSIKFNYKLTFAKV